MCRTEDAPDKVKDADYLREVHRNDPSREKKEKGPAQTGHDSLQRRE